MLRFLLGDKHKVTVLIPGDSIREIAICETEISYFTGLLEQLEIADFTTAEEIRRELISGGYIHEKNTRKKKKQKDQRPRFTETVSPSGIRISFGKNNLQNDDLTFHYARRNELWFHTKDYHGAHVVVHA